MSRPSVSPRLPPAGALILTIPGLSDVLLAANTESSPIVFQWPGPFVVSGFWLHEETVATPAAVANLKLRIQDSARNELVSDGTGALDAAGGLSFVGRSSRWHPFRRVVRSGQKYVFQIANDNAFQVRPLLYFKLEAE